MTALCADGQRQQRSGLGAGSGISVQRAEPAKVVGQVRGCDALEAAHPFLKPPVVRVDVLDVPGAAHAHAALHAFGAHPFARRPCARSCLDPGRAPAAATCRGGAATPAACPSGHCRSRRSLGTCSVAGRRPDRCAPPSHPRTLALRATRCLANSTLNEVERFAVRPAARQRRQQRFSLTRCQTAGHRQQVFHLSGSHAWFQSPKRSGRASSLRLAWLAWLTK